MSSSAPEALLIVKPSALGDVIQHVVVARALKTALPTTKIGWVVNAGFATILEPLSCIDKVHRFERGKLKGLRGAFRNRQALFELKGEMRKEGYEVAVDLQGLMRSAWLAKSSGASRVIGFRAAREMAWLLYRDAYRVDQAAHAIDRSFELLARAGFELDREIRTDLETSEDEREKVRAQLKGEAAPLVITPGARWPSKMWPADRWVELIRGLPGEKEIVLSGAPNEFELCSSIAERCSREVTNLAGDTNLRELAALFDIAELAVGNDSGPMHLARAQGTKLVALFGPTQGSLTGPWRRLKDVIAAPDVDFEHRMYRRIPDDRIMRRIAVDTVLEACLTRLAS